LTETGGGEFFTRSNFPGPDEIGWAAMQIATSAVHPTSFFGTNSLSQMRPRYFGCKWHLSSVSWLSHKSLAGIPSLTQCPAVKTTYFPTTVLVHRPTLPSNIKVDGQSDRLTGFPPII
jgi:hypothetical protein